MRGQEGTDAGVDRSGDHEGTAVVDGSQPDAAVLSGIFMPNAPTVANSAR